ncbi:MAG: SRPBCC domain-containing protein [Phycisphaerae bacterium]
MSTTTSTTKSIDHVNGVDTTNTPETSCVVRRTFRATPAAVFHAWTDPAFATRWAWGSKHETVSVSIDCRVGGVWKHEIQTRGGGETWSFEGHFREVVPGKRLVHTFFWRSGKGEVEGPSLVTIDFNAVAAGTEVVITHVGLPLAKRQSTNDGWIDVAACVERSMQGE